MAITVNFFGQTMMSFIRKEQDWLNDTYKAALCTTTAIPNKDTTTNFTGFTEISTTGYTAGGVALLNKTLTYNSSTDTVLLDCDNMVWDNLASATFRYLIIYNATNVNKPVLCWIDFGENVVVASSKFTVALTDYLGKIAIS